MSEATNRVLEAQLRRQKQHDKRQKEWESALKPTTIDGSGVLRQLGQQPLANRQILPNTASLNRPIRPTAVPGGVVADWLPRVKVEEVEVKVISKPSIISIIRETYEETIVTPDGLPIIDGGATFISRYRYYLYTPNNDPILFPEFDLLYIDTKTIIEPSEPGIVATFVPLDFSYIYPDKTIDSYNYEGSGANTRTFLYILRRQWITSQPATEPEGWGRVFSGTIATGREDSYVFRSVRVNEPTSLKYFSIADPRSEFFISADDKYAYVYRFVGFLTEQELSGIYYYRIPLRRGGFSLTNGQLPEPQVFLASGTFSGYSGDWRSSMPDFFTEDPSVTEIPGLCYSDDYGSKYINYFGRKKTASYPQQAPDFNGTLVIEKQGVSTNTSSLCELSEIVSTSKNIRSLNSDGYGDLDYDSLIISGR